MLNKRVHGGAMFVFIFPTLSTHIPSYLTHRPPPRVLAHSFYYVLYHMCCPLVFMQCFSCSFLSFLFFLFVYQPILLLWHLSLLAFSLPFFSSFFSVLSQLVQEFENFNPFVVVCFKLIFLLGNKPFQPFNTSQFSFELCK